MNSKRNLRLKKEDNFEAVRSKGKFDSHDHCILCKNVLPVHL